jgi:hypothetical protein
MDKSNGPVVRLPGDVATNSRVLGLPVVTDDGYNHAPGCHWCKGQANSDTCPRSVWLREYSRHGIEAAGLAED